MVDPGYVENHKEDNVFGLISEVAFNSKMAAYREKDSLDRSIPIGDRAVFHGQQKQFLDRVEWCKSRICEIIMKMQDEANAPLALRSVPVDVLVEALAPPVQGADVPHFTREHCEMLDEYFYMIPKADDGWIPSAEEV